MLPKFEYKNFTKLEDALTYLDEHKELAKPIAGGTDLMVQMKAGKIKPKYLADIEEIEDLSYIEEDDDKVKIGALTKMEEIRRSTTIREHAYNLWLSAQQFATWQVRNVATIGGNLCNASPASDTATPLISLKAEVVLKSVKGERKIPLHEFFKGPGITAMKPEELMTEIIFNKPNGARLNFIKLGRRTTHVLSIVNVAVKLTEKDGMIDDVVVALGSVAPRPVRSHTVESSLKGKKASIEVLKEASEKVINDISPITDVRASKEYRVEMSKVLTFKALRGVI